MARLAFAAFAAACGLAGAQVPIPNRPDGWLYKGGGAGQVIVDGFFDLMCPDCKAAWPTVKQVLEHYGTDKLLFRLHTFPLPYHHHAFYAAQGAHVVSSNVTAVYAWLEAVFAAQDSFGNDATASLTTDQVLQNFGNLAEKTLGIPAAKFAAAYPNVDYDTRISWKYTCSRGFSGTPSFLINDVPVAADPSWSAAAWEQVLDPLINAPSKAKKEHVHVVFHTAACPANTSSCEYLPGKVECCTLGEGCIPNVGCRCAAGAVGCERPALAACPANTKSCEYLPGKVECCTLGEGCIPNVGCRCAAGAANCQRLAVTACPANTKSCEYLPGKVECCTLGEGCIPNVGCRCAAGAVGCQQSAGTKTVV